MNTKFKKGHIPWSKLHPELCKPNSGSFQKGQNAEKESPFWKGDKVGYHALHAWVEKWKGIPKKCEMCGLDDQKRMYHWANVDHKYRRVLEDYIRMCVSCHRKYDYKNNLKPDNKVGNNQFKNIL